MGKIPSGSWDSNFNPRDERHWSFARDSRGYGLSYRWTSDDDFELDHPIELKKKSSVGTFILTIVLAVVLLALT